MCNLPTAHSLQFIEDIALWEYCTVYYTVCCVVYLFCTFCSRSSGYSMHIDSLHIGHSIHPAEIVRVACKYCNSKWKRKKENKQYKLREFLKWHSHLPRIQIQLASFVFRLCTIIQIEPKSRYSLMCLSNRKGCLLIKYICVTCFRVKRESVLTCEQLMIRQCLQ